MTGKIVSFYSFKGGVGRTMALANVAFIAALNGKRVLVIDWDLEAPGLAYYFRGLIDSGVAKELKQAYGILNVMWNWNTLIHSAKTAEDVTALVAELEADTYFSNLTTPLIEDDFPIPDCTLDYIGPGNDVIGISPDTFSYETALSEFSWSEFFNEAAGGRVIDALRRWAKSRYDYVFIDSRTGFADDAGVCTVQIPDVVALCFVLNRQNIDGVAKVAGVIRSARRDDVGVRCVTMRMNQANSAEESDAIARARRQLSRTGKLEIEPLDYDLRRLLIKTHSVPYYESLSPIAASVAQRDQLTLDFLNLAVELCGVGLEIPELPEAFVQRARERLQPSLATSDYLAALRGGAAEPERAASEVMRLLDNARAVEIDGEDLEEDYVIALINTAADVSEKMVDELDAQEILERLVDLLRDLYRLSPDKWRMPFADNLERLARAAGVYDLQDEEELAALDELDTVLAATEASPQLALRRVAAKRRVARIYIKNALIDDANRTVGDIHGLLHELDNESPLTSEQRNELLVSQVDLGMLHGDLSSRQEKTELAVEEYLKAFEIGQRGGIISGRSELQRSMFELAVRIAILEHSDVELSARYALEAARLHVSLGSIAPNFVKLVQAVLRSDSAPQMVVRFVQSALGRESRLSASALSGYLGRNSRSVEELLRVSIAAAELTKPGSNEGHSLTVNALSNVVIGSMRSLRRRQDQPSSGLTKHPRNVGGLLMLAQRWRAVAEPVLTDTDREQLIDSLNWLEGSRKGG